MTPKERSSRPSSSNAEGFVWLVGAGPGDPDLITWRGVELLGQAEVVLHDALSHPELLELCPQAEIRDVGKRYGKRATAQSEITAQLLQLAAEGRKVVRLKGGDPLLFARGSEEALALADAGVPFEIVPGVTSSVAASAYAGISLTHREASSSVTFITGSDRAGKEWSPDAWKKLATATGTICVYMGMRRIQEITQAVMDGGRDPNTPAAVVRWGGRPQQRTIVAPLHRLAERAVEEKMTSPAIIIIGEVVELRRKLRWYDNRALFGQKVLVPRPAHQARETAKALRQRAAAPLVCPAIEILPAPDSARLARAVREAGSYDWVVFTSANGVSSFFEEVERAGLDARVFGSARLAVIGPKTGEALRSFGLKADLCARTYVAESLLEDLLAQGTPTRVLIPRAKEARELLPEELRAAGALVDVVPAYETRSVSGEAAARLREAVVEQADVVLLTSSSMVDSLVAALGPEARELLDSVTVACIGPITAKTAKKHQLRVHVESQVHTVAGVLDALEAHFSMRKSSPGKSSPPKSA